jgi:cholesterol oxidase
MEQEDRVSTVIVGSGFGGAPLACRLAQANEDVCVLERGQAWPPGSFPRSPRQMGRNFWDPSDGLYGLFNPWSFRHVESVVSSGLGGGSLIYANVLLRKDEESFVEPDGHRWPLGPADLERDYTRAERELGANPYPLEREPYASTQKTLALKRAAERLRDAGGVELAWGLPNLAVTFTPPAAGPAVRVTIPEARANYHGLPRSTCRLVGECDIGCNLGAKNSLDYTYLTAAKHAGARIETLCEVRLLSEHPDGGWQVEYDRHLPDPDRPAAARRTRRHLRADRVVLAAGTLGTTYLLLRNRAALPRLSSTLGSRFSGNGDFLAFALRCFETTSSGRRQRALDPSHGPVITSYVHLSDERVGEAPPARGIYIEDAGWPEIVNWLAHGLDTPAVLWRAGRWARNALRQRLDRDVDSDVGAELTALFGPGTLTDATMGMLGMGRDVGDGRLRLRGQDRLDVDWSTKTSAAYLERMRAAMRGLVEQLGGDYLEPPTSRSLGRLITVHPLGGCPMGRDAGEGVVNSFGRVFGYDGLFVSDGSVMPGPVGANPSLTIAAFAERLACNLLEGRDGHA